jgi:hypothetical protein
MSESADPNDECVVKSAISEPQLKLDFSVLNKKESFMKIKPPVPKQILPTDQVSSSIESEANSSDGRTFKVFFRCRFNTALYFFLDSSPFRFSLIKRRLYRVICGYRELN